MKNKKLSKLETITILLISISIFLYEICFCNLKNIITNGTYNFSLFRVVMYIIFFILYKKFANKFIEEARKTLQSKRKIIYIYLAIVIIYTIYKLIIEKNYYTLTLIILTELNGLLFILYISKDYIKNIIITILTLGFIFSISTDVYHMIDEKKHFLSTLNVAVGNFNFKEALTDEEFNNIEFESSTVNFAMEYFGKRCSLNMQKIPENESIFSTPAEYSPMLYIPSSIGINIARLLGGSMADVYIAGRMFNIIAYGILLVIMFKLLPLKKNLFYAIYLMPMLLVLAASYSIDGIVVGVIGIFIAYILKLYKENYNKIDLKKFITMVILFLLTLICKSGAYIAISLIVFILPMIKIMKENVKIRNTVILILLITLFVGIYQTFKIATPSEGDVRGGNTSPSKQIEFLLENPTNIVKLYSNYLRLSVFNFNWYNDFNLKIFFGQYYSVITFLLFIFILYIAITDNTYTFNKKEKTITSLSFWITFFITTFILYLSYTEVGKLTISGYQPRYLIPVLPLLLMNINSKKIVNKETECDYNKISMISGGLIFLDLLAMIVR